ncbi:MAG: type II toxin-antitoxin system RelE/ParE family toxin [Coriobacteriia bacterium]|nr:type II toxin-antitoxin system RelE/ParE family toxin [Coriobacteriia bacterium]
MPGFHIEFAPAAYRQFAKLPADAQKRIAPKIDSLTTDPRPPGVKRLLAKDELYRIRVGAYRIVYAIEDARLVVLIVKIGHRRDVYREL